MNNVVSLRKPKTQKETFSCFHFTILVNTSDRVQTANIQRKRNFIHFGASLSFSNRRNSWKEGKWSPVGFVWTDTRLKDWSDCRCVPRQWQRRTLEWWMNWTWNQSRWVDFVKICLPVNPLLLKGLPGWEPITERRFHERVEKVGFGDVTGNGDKKVFRPGQRRPNPTIPQSLGPPDPWRATHLEQEVRCWSCLILKWTGPADNLLGAESLEETFTGVLNLHLSC